MKAHLVAHIDTSVSPPKFLGVEVYSESAMNLTGAIGMKTFCLDIYAEEGESYASALKHLGAGLRMQPFCRVFEWTIPLMSERTKKDLGL